MDSHLQSGRLLGKEQVREKHRMKGSVQSIEDVCVRVNINIQEVGFTEGERVCESLWFVSGVRMDKVIIWKNQHIGSIYTPGSR